MVVAKLAAVRELLDEVSSLVTSGMPDAELVDVLHELETLKRLACAVQAEATVAFRDSVRAADAVRGIPSERQGKSVAPQVALARSASPYAGGMLVGASTALVREMTNTFTALRAGRIEEWVAIKLVGATAFLSLEERVEVDRALGAELGKPGVHGNRLIGSARALAQKLDPAAAVKKIRKAETERYVSVRPAPDAMAWLTALLPMKDAIQCHAALKKSIALTDRAVGDERTNSQLEADLLVQRLTGHDPLTEAVPVTVSVVMTDQTLLGRGEAPATIPGLGALPAEVARDLVADAAEQDVAWVRQLFTSPWREQLVAMSSTQRCFPKGLADFIRIRDQRCSTPFCGAPIRHLDHVTPAAAGGATSVGNGQGLCVGCNLTKELPGFTSTRDDAAGRTTVTTPTGHTYVSTDPPPLGYPEKSPGVIYHWFTPPVPGARLVFRYPVLCWKFPNTGEFRLTA